MTISTSSAFVDNDFINHVAEIRNTEDQIIRIFAEVVKEFGVNLLIHPLIVEHEVMSHHKVIKKILECGLIDQPPIETIHCNDKSKKDYYKYLVRFFYQKIFGAPLCNEGEDIFTYWKKDSSLGEIHSIASCLICECGIFLSDDRDSKFLRDIVASGNIGSITVYSRDDVVSLLRQKGTNLTRKELQSFKHVPAR